MKVKITKGFGWYEDLVGEVFDVAESDSINGFLRYYVDPRGFSGRRFIRAENCEIVSEDESKGDAMSEKYPKYYKDVSDLTEIDVYAVHQLFGIDDPSGALHHASKKLLLSGVRTGGKSKYDDIKEARDTLTRWLDLAKEGE